MTGWGPVRIAIKCGGSEGRAAVERRVREKGFLVHHWDDFLHDLTLPNRTLFDFETRADESVSDLGAWKYAAQPSNEILCVGWTSKPAEKRTLVCHNTAFEQAHCERHIPGFVLDPTEWSCTASRARRLGIPGNLEGACKVLRTPNQKSMEGHGIMLQCCQPRPTYSRNPALGKWFDDPDRLAANAVYCGQDIFAERDLDDLLPELPPHEREIWLQVERGNRRGLALDAALLNAMAPMVAGEDERVLNELRAMVGDVDTFLTSPAKVRDFCAGRGVHLPNLQKETVLSVLEAHRTGRKIIDPIVVKVLEGRQIVGKSSNAKIPAMLARLQPDGFARDYAIFHGAHTGRQTGAAVNPLNLPKPYKGYDQEKVVGQILRNDLSGLAKDRVSPTLAVSASLRGTIIAPAGKQLVIGDYSVIEPCVTFTLAGQWDAVKILREKGDIYCDMASSVYGRHVTKENKAERALGKALVLGCGYGLGADMFFVRSQNDPDLVKVDEKVIRTAHGGYRVRFNKIKPLWEGIEAAAKESLRVPHTRFAYGVVSYVFDGWWLIATLPSGRSLFYPNARIQPGKYNDELVYEGRLMGGGWGDVRTWGGSLVENLAQSISRDITMEDKLECERRYGWHIPLDVYDEIVAEADENDPHAKEKLEAVMCRSRPWLPEIPISAEVFTAKRYRKE